MKRLGVACVVGLLVLGVASRTVAEPPVDAERDRLLAQRAERAREQLKQRLALLSGSATPPAASAAPSSSALPLAAPSGSAVPASVRVVELARRWHALGENRHERREQHRAALVRQLGQRLSDPRVKDELKLHATRVAELARLQFLAENARSGAQRDKLLARIAKLSARERERHEKQLARLAAAATAPSLSAAPSPAGAPSGSKP